MTLLNGTPHQITIFSETDCTFDSASRKLILNEGAQPLVVVPPSGVILNAKIVVTPPEIVDGVPYVSQKFESIDDPTAIPSLS